MAVLSVGQSLTVVHSLWGLLTTLRLVAAFVVGGALITLLDPILHPPEELVVPIAHGGCGLVLGAVQSRALPAAADATPQLQ